MHPSPYSPFFNSGLLSEPSSTQSSRPPSPLPPRRGSLPTDSPYSTHHHSPTHPHHPSTAHIIPTSAPDDSAAFYFTLQPKRSSNEYRSFLSLDLAESQSLRSLSLKRKASNASKSTTSWSWKPEVSLMPKHSRATKATSSKLARSASPVPSIPPMPSIFQTQSQPQSSAHSHKRSKSRNSRENLRSLPSPKPAPCAVLPAVPGLDASPTLSTSLPPCLPPIPVTPPLRLSALQNTSNPAATQPLGPVPSPCRVSRMKQPASPPPSTARAPHTRTSSVASSGQRKISRSDALACLEGRRQPPAFIGLPFRRGAAPNKEKVRRNFMSMSDDEDEVDDGPTGNISFSDEEDDDGEGEVVYAASGVMGRSSRRAPSSVPGVVAEDTDRLSSEAILALAREQLRLAAEVEVPLPLPSATSSSTSRDSWVPEHKARSSFYAATALASTSKLGSNTNSKSHPTTKRHPRTRTSVTHSRVQSTSKPVPAAATATATKRTKPTNRTNAQTDSSWLVSFIDLRDKDEERSTWSSNSNSNNSNSGSGSVSNHGSKYNSYSTGTRTGYRSGSEYNSASSGGEGGIAAAWGTWRNFVEVLGAA